MKFETTTLDGVVYDLAKLRSRAELYPIHELPLVSLRALVAPGQFYWLDRDELWLSPAQILADWPAARGNQAWTEHIDRILHANLSWPIWLKPCPLQSYRLLDGAHRLTRAFIEDLPTVPARIFLDLPIDAIAVSG